MRCVMLFQGLVYEIVMLFQGLVDDMCNVVPGFGL